jgi:hypothetical protein
MGFRAGLDGAEKLDHTGIRFPDPPARSESLCSLRCPGPLLEQIQTYFFSGFEVLTAMLMKLSVLWGDAE